MPRPMAPINLNDALRRYQAGETLKEIADQMGVARDTVRSRLLDAGVALRGKGDTNRLRVIRYAPDLNEAFVRYERGETMEALCREFGVGRKLFTHLLTQAGIQPRTQRQSIGMRYTRMTSAERLALTESAHAAKRGRPASPASLERRALTMEHTLQLADRNDLVLAVWLAQRGVKFTIQKAVGPYNIDIAMHEPAVAVEVTGSRHRLPHFAARQADPEQRRRYLLDRGWRMIEVRIEGDRHTLRESTADKIISLLDQARWQEPAWGEYLVIWGNGEAFTTSEDQSNHRA